MKKNLLFVINNLTSGGAEKALISLLGTLDYSKYNVDLFLFKHEGLFFSQIPKQVNLLEEPKEYKYFDMSIKKALFDCVRNGRFDIAIYRLLAGFIFKNEKKRTIIGQLVWKYISKSVQRINKHYDAAIGYLEGYPIYFCVDNVDAKRKLGFIHNDYDKLGVDPVLDLTYFDKLDSIITVSEACSKILKERFPNYSHKVKVLYNIVSPKIIQKMSYEKIELNKGFKIVSVGRLNKQKGFELAIEACKLLIDQGYQLQWYIIGEGEERVQLETMIEENNLKDIVILLGLKENPYPYIREADLYVQSSRFEGKSIAIDEAKILQKPIVVTNFSTAKDQIQNNYTGLIVDMNAQSIYEGTKSLIDNEQLRISLIANLKNEALGTESEVEKLYELFA
jgi:glycosyltransferase involved in cell wall biosynthesis